MLFALFVATGLETSHAPRSSCTTLKRLFGTKVVLRVRLLLPARLAARVALPAAKRDPAPLFPIIKGGMVLKRVLCVPLLNDINHAI